MNVLWLCVVCVWGCVFMLRLRGSWCLACLCIARDVRAHSSCARNMCVRASELKYPILTDNLCRGWIWINNIFFMSSPVTSHTYTYAHLHACTGFECTSAHTLPLLLSSASKRSWRRTFFGCHLQYPNLKHYNTDVVKRYDDDDMKEIHFYFILYGWCVCVCKVDSLVILGECGCVVKRVPNVIVCNFKDEQTRYGVHLNWKNMNLRMI